MLHTANPRSLKLGRVAFTLLDSMSNNKLLPLSWRKVRFLRIRNMSKFAVPLKAF